MPIKPIRRWKTTIFFDPTIDIYTGLDEPDGLAIEFRQFSEDIITLFECFAQYPEFLEELPNSFFAEDIKVCTITLTVCAFLCLCRSV